MNDSASWFLYYQGTLLRKLENGLRGVSHVIVDEIHERDINVRVNWCWYLKKCKNNFLIYIRFNGLLKNEILYRLVTTCNRINENVLHPKLFLSKVM